MKEEDYPALLTIFAVGDRMPRTWNEWLRIAEEMERGLIGTHIHGAHAPVEEPSTASIADVSSCNSLSWARRGIRAAAPRPSPGAQSDLTQFLASRTPHAGHRGQAAMRLAADIILEPDVVA